MLRLFFLPGRLRRAIIRALPFRRARRSAPARPARAASQIAQKPKALSAAAIRAQMHALPKATVRYVIDGDTVIVTKGWREHRIRLDSIDCPEDGQHWGDIARYGLIKLVGRRRVLLETHGWDDYGRTVATIYVRHQYKDEWLNVNERMVTLGHAWVMRRYYDHLPPDRKDKLNHLERWARSRNVGLWASPNPIPPWQWRNGR